MKTIFEQDVRKEVISRINSLKQTDNPQWGTMNVCQMINHCMLWDEMVFGKMNLKRSFFGRLVGKIVLRRIIRDNRYLPRNISTLPELAAPPSNEDIEPLKEKWIRSINHYEFLGKGHNFIHPFFGRMNKEQTGLLAYKHIDHHLRQFRA